MPTLLEILTAELERPREVTAQVVNHVIVTYGLTRDDVGNFLSTKLPALEEYEQDLVLSPLFTPALKDQAVVAATLMDIPLPATEWPSLVQQLLARPTQASLITEDRQVHRLVLPEVVLDRWVRRLRLDGEIPAPLFALIKSTVASPDQPMLFAIARRATWQAAPRREILVRFLTTSTADGTFRLADAVELLKLAETYQPADRAELRRLIPHWQQVLRQEINTAGGAKPFFNERVEDLHGGGRDQRRQDNSRRAALESERDFLHRLERLLAA